MQFEATVPTFEDKVLQRGVTMVLEAIYEQDFKNCSWGFRPKRSAHRALEDLREGLMKLNGGWVLEVDIQGFFDTLDRSHLRSFLSRRVRDGVLRRTIDKWLEAGVFESGSVTHPELGTPQGGVISPILANIYLHDVLDVWFEDVVKPRLMGQAHLVRYADDFVIVLERGWDARRVMNVLPKRFGKYGLTLHPEKTRLVHFQRPNLSAGPKGTENGERPGTFDFLGFTHHWSRSQRGMWVVKRKTAKSRLSRGLKAITAWCRTNRHRPVRMQHQSLVKKLKGHYAYYGITGNAEGIGRFREGVRSIWRKWLASRSQRARMGWKRYNRLLEHYPLPQAIAVHSILRRRSKAVT